MSRLNDEILELLVCPKTKLPLNYASDALVKRVNAAIAEQSLSFLDGALITEPVHAILVRSDKKIGYGVFERIPNLLAEEAISLEKV